MLSNRELTFIHSQARNRIILCKKTKPNLKWLNLGSVLSKKLLLLEGDTKLPLKALIIINEILEANIINDSSCGHYLAIKNLGILFEPELKTDFVQILDKYSSLNTLFVKWDGEIEDGILYFLTKEKGQKIDIKNLSHIVI